MTLRRRGIYTAAIKALIRCSYVRKGRSHRGWYLTKRKENGSAADDRRKGKSLNKWNS